MKKYEAPELHIDEFVADTMIASDGDGEGKNGNADNNQNCWGCKLKAGAWDPENHNNNCAVIPGDALYALC